MKTKRLNTMYKNLIAQAKDFDDEVGSLLIETEHASDEYKVLQRISNDIYHVIDALNRVSLELSNYEIIKK